MSESSKRRAATRAARARQRETGEPYAEAKRRTADDATGDTPLVVTVTPIEISHPQGFGGHEFEYQSTDDLFRCVRCGGYEIALRDPATGEIGACRRRGSATVTLDGQRWRITTSDGSYPTSRGGTMSWRVGVPMNDRACFLEQVGGELAVYGWEITWPELPDPVPSAVELVLARNDRGVDLDEAELLHRAAGVDYHQAHGAYIRAVAKAVVATGMPIHDFDTDFGSEPREGCFTLGEEPEDLDELADMIVWRDSRGWYHVEHPDHRGTMGDGPFALPGLSGLTPPPHEVAAAVLRAFPIQDPTEPEPWPVPAGYDPDPPQAEDDGFSVSAALERSLVAYVKPRVRD